MKREVTHTWDIPDFSLYKLVHTDCGNWGVWKKKYTDDKGRTYNGFAVKFSRQKAGWMGKMVDDYDRQRTISLHVVIMNVLSPHDKSNCVKFLDGNKYNLRLDNMVWADGPNQQVTEDPNIAIQKYGFGLVVGRFIDVLEKTGLSQEKLLAITLGKKQEGWILAPHAKNYAPGFYEAVATR